MSKYSNHISKEQYLDIFEKYLERKAAPEEIALLLEWIKTQEFDDWVVWQWEKADGSADDFVLSQQTKIFEKIKNKLQIEETSAPIRRRLYLTISKVAAVVLATVVLTASGYFFFMEKSTDALADAIVYVQRGQKANVVLPDGSKVWLNSESKLIYGMRFNDKERVVSLEGEAYFEVAHNQNASFIVQTKDLNVKVYGTSFNVNTYAENNEVKVALIEGSVEVLPQQSSSFLLKPNDIAVYNIESKHATIEDVDDNVIGWRNNHLRFKDESLTSIMRVLSRNYNLEITISNPSIEERRFTGDFSENETVEKIFDIMSSNDRFRYTIAGNAIIVY